MATDFARLGWRVGIAARREDRLKDIKALYPDRVKSLAMYRPTDTASEAERGIVKARYFDIADAAAISMHEAVRYSEDPPPHRWSGISRWLADLYKKDSEKILGMDNGDFSRIIAN